MNKLGLQLDEKNYLVFVGQTAIDQCRLWDYINLTLLTNGKQYILYDREIDTALKTLIFRLKTALKNNLILGFSINKDIGYLYNEYFQMSIAGRIDYDWPACSKSAFEAPGRQPYLTTWLYNDLQGNIIIHVTENYYWHFLDKSEGKNYISYKKFIKNYKPIWVKIIPHHTARKWLAECEYLLSIVKKNEARFIKEHGTALPGGKCQNCPH